MKIKYRLVFALICCSVITFTGCSNRSNTQLNSTDNPAQKVSIMKSLFGKTPDGQAVYQYSLRNKQGMVVEIITYGGTIIKWTAPDRNGNYENIVLGFDNLDQYIHSSPYFGAIVGRYGNRIARGKFSIDGNTYMLETNDGSNHLHGGITGFDKVLWDAEEISSADKVALKLSYLSKDGEEGYPGNLQVIVIYTLSDDNSLEVSYEATTDKKTIVNLTQHSYFNLSGNFQNTIIDHELMIQADAFVEVDSILIPTGKILPVDNSPFDFRAAKAIGKDIEINNEQLIRGRGYDHCWVLNSPDSLKKAASVYHPQTGRVLEVITDQPGIQFYCGNFLDGTLPIPGGGTYMHRTGFCLETQHFPDSPNQPSFPAVLLAPNELYQTKTVFKFATR